jgi:hypothetical protein
MFATVPPMFRDACLSSLQLHVRPQSRYVNVQLVLALSSKTHGCPFNGEDGFRNYSGPFAYSGGPHTEKLPAGLPAKKPTLSHSRTSKVRSSTRMHASHVLKMFPETWRIFGIFDGIFCDVSSTENPPRKVSDVSTSSILFGFSCKTGCRTQKTTAQRYFSEPCRLRVSRICVILHLADFLSLKTRCFTLTHRF